MLKRFLSVFFFLILFAGFKGGVFALTDDLHCTDLPSGSVYVGSSSCKKNGFDCDNYMEGVSKEECEEIHSGCYEGYMDSGLLSTTTYLCYLPEESTIVTDECGYIGSKGGCCTDSDTKEWYCNEGEVTITDYGMDCSCTVTGGSEGLLFSSLNEGDIYDPLCDSGTEINTALGCVPVEMSDFIPWLLSWVFGVAGGIAFLLMSYGFILIATSSGDEKKLQGAKETITSAIIGLLVCVFAIFILRLIAIDILQIPGI